MSKVSFDHFAPRLCQGRVIPQGRRLIYVTNEGDKQIVLPIEMADAILLATGKYTMRQIIEKIFIRKGSLHFRTLFKTIHQLRDHGFLENGDELESYSWWHSPDKKTKPWVFDRVLIRRRSLHRQRPVHFYFLSMMVITLSLLSLMSMPWPPISSSSFSHSALWNLVLTLGFISLMQTCQSFAKALFQLLLTGNMFGLHLRISTFGIYCRTTDEPIFLIHNRLFLLLYHLANLLTPALCLWPLTLLSTQYYEFAFAMISFKFMWDLSPFTQSLFMQTMRSMLSLGQSDLVGGYLREDSLLSLLSPAGRVSFNLRLQRYFTVYILLWSAVAFWLCSGALYGTSEQLEVAPWSAVFNWIGLSSALVWVAVNLGRHLRPMVLKIVIRMVGKIRSLILKWKPTEWTHEKTIEVLSRLPLFSNFSPTLLDMILAHSTLSVARGGSRLITQGEIGQDLFVLLEGSLLIEQSSDQGRKRLSILRPITIFGEMAMVEECERSADVIAKDTSSVLKIPTSILRVAAKESQYVREIEAFRNAIMVNQFFTSAPMFKDLPEDTVHDITMRSSMRHFASEKEVISQGSMGRSFFMVLRGAVEVRIHGKSVKKIRQGGFFGEIALIADIPRTASVVTTEPTVLLEMAAVNFWEILCQNIELAMFIEAVGESRLHEDLLNSEMTAKAG